MHDFAPFVNVVNLQMLQKITQTECQQWQAATLYKNNNAINIRAYSHATKQTEFKVLSHRMRRRMRCGDTWRRIAAHPI